jgi:hypothetical protein
MWIDRKCFRTKRRVHDIQWWVSNVQAEFLIIQDDNKYQNYF